MGKLVKFAIFCALAYGVYFQFLRADWHEFADPDGHFTAQFPTQPRHVKERLRIVDELPPVTTNLYTAKNSDRTAEYLIVSLSARWLARGVDDTDKILNATIDSFAERSNLRIVKREAVMIDGYPGIEARVMDTYGLSLDMRTMLVDDRLYIVGAGSHDMSRVLSGRTRFLNAFELL